MKANIHTAEQPDSDITAFFLSCDRLDLLEIAIETFEITVNEPVKKILYDDSANPAVFPKLVEKYGDRFDIYCYPENRGQWIAYDHMSTLCYTKYIFYVEDDWVFTDTGYMQISKQILESDRTIGGVDISEPLCKDLDCIGEETESFFWKKPWRISEQYLYWLGWMGSPNLRRREDYILLGRIEALNGPEWLIDRKFNLMGLKSVWSKKPYVKHIGWGRSKMDGKRPNEHQFGCDICPLEKVCKLPRIDWYKALPEGYVDTTY